MTREARERQRDERAGPLGPLKPPGSSGRRRRQRRRQRREVYNDHDRLVWLGVDASRLEDVRWTMINDDVDIRAAIDKLRAL